MDVRLRATFGILALVVLVGGPSPSGQQQPPQTPTFRAGITLVPFDVRALDRDGKPVTDLDESEFTILEDGVAQKILHFSHHMLVAEQPRPGLRARADASPFDTSPPDFRVFLIIAGGGSLNPDWKTLQALARFIRERLLPQDQVAFIANNRATDFTTDHEKVAQALERLGRPTGSRTLSAAPGKPIPLTSQKDPVFRDPEPLDRSPAPATNLGFEEYIGAVSGALGEADAVRYGIRYLRYMPGEKHIIAVSRSGLGFRTYEDVKRFAADASDARVALNVIHTGGIPASPGPFLSGALFSTADSSAPTVSPRPASTASADIPAESGRVPTMQPKDAAPPLSITPLARWPVPIPGYTADDLIRFADNRAVSRLTGGQASINEYPGKAVDRLDVSSRSYYLLAYSPSRANWDGRYRSIKVKVSRPGVTVLARNGYFARETTPVLDRRKYLTESRIGAAGVHTGDLNDLQVGVTISIVPAGQNTPAEAVVELSIDAARLSFAETDGRHVGSLNVALFCGDKNQTIVGELRQTLDLALEDATYERVMREGLRHTARVTLKRLPRYVKAIVYDYGSDLLGSTLVTLPQGQKTPRGSR
jgi:VWFA-related protein